MDAPSRGSRCGAPYRCAGGDQSLLDEAEVDAAGALLAAGVEELLLSPEEEAAGAAVVDDELSDDDEEEEDFDDELEPLRLSVL